MPFQVIRVALSTALILTAAPALAQDPGNDVPAPESPTPPPEAPPTIFDGDWITFGAGVAYSASYDGSDDYLLSPLLFLQGRLRGVSINPRPAGLALDFVPDGDGPVISTSALPRGSTATA
jgi:hypothetical protein